MKRPNSNTYWLVTWNGNWADEIDLTAHEVMNNESWEEFREYFETNSSREFTVYFGTNEEQEMTCGEYLDGCSAIQIPSHEMIDFLEKNVCEDCEWSPSNVWDNVSTDDNDGDIDDTDEDPAEEDY